LSRLHREGLYDEVEINPKLEFLYLKRSAEEGLVYS